MEHVLLILVTGFMVVMGKARPTVEAPALISDLRHAHFAVVYKDDWEAAAALLTDC